MRAFWDLVMMACLIVVVLGVAGVYVLLRQLNKPKYYRGITRDAFPKFINGMMAQGGVPSQTGDPSFDTVSQLL